jgi:hypothetical protein
MVNPRVPPLADAGFHLVECETDTGQLVWEWRRGREPKPQFVTRRVAIYWMAEYLEREHGVTFVSNIGQSYSPGFVGPLRRQLEDRDDATVRTAGMSEEHQP